MFPLLRNRAARALDVAIEFATLGEYRLAVSPAQGAPARGARRAVPAERRDGAPARPAARLLEPASAAGRRPVPDPRLRPAPIAGGAAMAQLALDGAGLVPTPPVRVRGGAAAPPPQPCEAPRR
jgi:hypothetical protein